MQIVDYFKPGILSLFLFLLLPFTYYFFHYKFWHNYKLQRAIDFILVCLSLLLALIVIFKSYQIYRESKFSEYLYLSLLHIIPLIETFLLIRFKNPLSKYELAKLQHNFAIGTENQAQTEKPINQNKEIDNITWDDLVIPQALQLEIMTVIELLRDPKKSVKYGVKTPKGIILSGPPGNGKTTIAKVIANTAGLAFFSFSADQVISKWVGESEKNLSQLFEAALAHRPSIIFIDEIDSIGKRRSGGNESWSENLLNHLLQLIDGVYSSEGVYIIGATNRADLIDPALKRSGRLNKEIEVTPPDYTSRVHLFQLYLKQLKLEKTLQVEALAKMTEGYSAADIAGLCNQAGINSFQREAINGVQEYLVKEEDIVRAIQKFQNEKINSEKYNT